MFLSILAFVACGQSNDTTVNNQQELNAPPKPELVISQVEDREPQVDMINVEFYSGQSKHTSWIQDRDAKYFLVDGGHGSKLSFKIEGGHPSVQLIVINPQDEMVYRQNVNGKPLTWNGSFDESGRYTFIVQLDSKLQDKNQIRTQFNVLIEKEGF